ncbi:JAB domain-containing protein [Pseudomonas putida]|uniref:JAB domain-containing protein n=1 Tax=Pseudomonas putida TaxID=303 RepID=UPI001F51D192|nr:JAB domain-containing protein [Pseudomonas putida]
MKIREWPAEERPREKLMQRGVGSLSDAELLAVFLGSGVRGRNVVELARGLLARFGGLRQLLEADREAFVGELGLGPVRYGQLQALLEIGRRNLATAIERDCALESPSAVRRYLKAMLRHEPSEVFGCLFLDSKHRPLAFEILFRGTIDRASIYPREVVRRSLMHNAAALILTGYGVKRLVAIGCDTRFRRLGGGSLERWMLNFRCCRSIPLPSGPSSLCCY